MYKSCGLNKDLLFRPLDHAMWVKKSFLGYAAIYVSHVERKPVFGIFDQVRLKPACSATEAS